MITKKTPEEIETLQTAGRILAKILKELAKEAVPGVTTLSLDDRAMELAEELRTTWYSFRRNSVGKR